MTQAEHQSRIAFQGELGAYSHLSCLQAYPDHEPLPCKTFEDAFEAVRSNRAALAMIPLENNLGGRVAEVHYLMRLSDLQIIGEHFFSVNHHLLGLPGSELAKITDVYSHEQALDQCRSFIKSHQIRRHVYVDTAGAAKYVAQANDPSKAALASKAAGEVYGLASLVENTQDKEGNTTRFVILAKADQAMWPASREHCITSFMFRLSSVPAALYKALGGFATNGINMIKLESYVDESFSQAEFYAEIVGHVRDSAVQRSLDELAFFTDEYRIMGVYPRSAHRPQS